MKFSETTLGPLQDILFSLTSDVPWEIVTGGAIVSTPRQSIDGESERNLARYITREMSLTDIS